MNINGHDIGFYYDGHKQIEHCRICSAEGYNLGWACSGEYENDLDKPVDIDNEEA